VNEPSSTAEQPAGKPLAKLGLPSGISIFAAKLILSALLMAWPALHADGAAMIESGPGSVRLQGSAKSLRLEAHDSTIAAVLAAMGRAFQVQYHSATPLDDAVTGTYAGSLRGVIAQILHGYDYLIKDEGSGVEVAVFGRSSGRAVPSALSPAPAAPVRHARCGQSAGHRAACPPI
jgi:hypothetical protein